MSILGFLSSSEGKESTYNAGDPVQSLGWEDPLDKGVATHYRILENSMERGAWWATVHGITKSWT